MSRIELLAFALSFLLIPHFPVEESRRIIRVAIYDYPDEFNKKQILMALQYTWEINGKTFTFSYKFVKKKDVIEGKLKDYDHGKKL